VSWSLATWTHSAARVRNLKAVAQAAGDDLGDMVKLNAFLTDLGHFAGQSRQRNLRQRTGSRRRVAALPRGAAVEMDGILEL
jgi:enamine deaminase RidA (YjgF/YER057c/UK114 family)